MSFLDPVMKLMPLDEGKIRHIINVEPFSAAIKGGSEQKEEFLILMRDHYCQMMISQRM